MQGVYIGSTCRGTVLPVSDGVSIGASTACLAAPSKGSTALPRKLRSTSRVGSALVQELLRKSGLRCTACAYTKMTRHYSRASLCVGQSGIDPVGKRADSVPDYFIPDTGDRHRCEQQTVLPSWFWRPVWRPRPRGILKIFVSSVRFTPCHRSGAWSSLLR
jgi:hypothetical protein